MNKIKIVTDNTGLLSKDYASKYDIDIVPLKIDFCNETLTMKYSDDLGDYYERLKESKDFPKTSQPSTGEFVEVYNKAFEDYEEIVVVTMSSGLSGTYNSACLAAELSGKKDKIKIIDTLTTVANLKYMVETAANMAQQGKTSCEIEKKILSIRDNMGTYLYVDKLEYLRRGGRISATKAAVGTILNVKPIVIFNEGVLTLIDKVRGNIKAKKYLISKIPKDVKRITVCQILNIPEAEKIKKQLEEEFPNATVEVDGVSPIIGSHLGEYTIGLVYSME